MPPEKPAALAMTFSAIDPDVALDGKHTMFVWAQWHPYELANGVAEAAFNTARTIVHTTTTSTKGVIYGFDIAEMPARVEETDTGLGHYELSLIMYYRGLD